MIYRAVVLLIICAAAYATTNTVPSQRGYVRCVNGYLEIGNIDFIDVSPTGDKSVLNLTNDLCSAQTH